MFVANTAARQIVGGVLFRWRWRRPRAWRLWLAGTGINTHASNFSLHGLEVESHGTLERGKSEQNQIKALLRPAHSCRVDLLSCLHLCSDRSTFSISGFDRCCVCGMFHNFGLKLQGRNTAVTSCDFSCPLGLCSCPLRGRPGCNRTSVSRLNVHLMSGRRTALGCRVCEFKTIKSLTNSSDSATPKP